MRESPRSRQQDPRLAGRVAPGEMARSHVTGPAVLAEEGLSEILQQPRRPGRSQCPDPPRWQGGPQDHRRLRTTREHRGELIRPPARHAQGPPAPPSLFLALDRA